MSKKKIIGILAVLVLLGLGILVHDYIDTRKNFDGKLIRNNVGQGSYKQELEIEFLDKKEDIQIEVSERAMSDDEVAAAFEEAIAEIEESYLGKNSNPNKIMWDLNLKSSYCDGKIIAYWKFDNYGIISSEGKLNEEAISEEGDVVNLTAELSYEDESQLYSFSVVVYPLSLDTDEGKVNAIKKAVSNADEIQKDKSVLALPNEVENMSLIWKKKMNYRGLQIILLEIITVGGLVYGQKHDEKKEKQRKLNEKERDYPQIVSELSILLGAGLSFRKALERIVSKYELRKKQSGPRAGYEELVCTYRKIVDGMGELSALEDLGLKCDSKEYRKLAMLLTQNLRKGSRDLLDSLEKEEAYAFERRKQLAIKAGEEASTKLLIPMAGMLFVVIVILIVPALLQMNI